MPTTGATALQKNLMDLPQLWMELLLPLALRVGSLWFLLLAMNNQGTIRIGTEDITYVGI